jgi:hypothetical protein
MISKKEVIPKPSHPKKIVNNLFLKIKTNIETTNRNREEKKNLTEETPFM